MGEGGTLGARLREVGFPVGRLEAATGGAVAVAGLATLEDGRTVFAKTLPPAPRGEGTPLVGAGHGPGPDVFEVEAAGLAELRERGGARTPEVLHVSRDVLVLQACAPCPDDDPRFWERLGRMVAHLHTSTAAERFGWHRDGWLGRMRLHNPWTADGHAFFAEHRILRWLPEPRVEAAFDRADRQAVERLCALLPKLIPPRPAALTHGDLWYGNVLADLDGAPVLIDPAVSHTWPEVDLSMLWCAPRPPSSQRFFAAYQEVCPLEPGWRARMPVLHLRELLSVIAHGDDDWGAADEVRRITAPFR